MVRATGTLGRRFWFNFVTVLAAGSAELVTTKSYFYLWKTELARPNEKKGLMTQSSQSYKGLSRECVSTLTLFSRPKVIMEYVCPIRTQSVTSLERSGLLALSGSIVGVFEGCDTETMRAVEEQQRKNLVPLATAYDFR